MHQLKLKPASLEMIAKRLLYILPISIITGLLVALFLYLLELVTDFRFNHPWIIAGLPLAGVIIAWIYGFTRNGNADEADISRGNDLIIDEIHQPGHGVAGKITPLILFSTLITHL